MILLDRYELLEAVGQGGTSEVYLARDMKLQCYWAVKKIFKRDLFEQTYDASKEEIRLLTTLHHPCIPRIVDQLETSDYHYVVMDFIDGLTLFQMIKENGLPSEEQILKWMIELVNTIKYLHDTKPYPIIYRDVKPENILLTTSGHIQLIDFGIALQKDPNTGFYGPYVGTKGYASPEQYDGHFIDIRSDIYSIGATIFYLCTGVKYKKDVTIKQMQSDISIHLCNLVERCLQDEPNDRYVNCDELHKALASLLQNHTKQNSIKKQVAPFFLSTLITILMILSFVLGQLQWEENNRISYREAMMSKDYALAIQYQQHYIEPYLLYYEQCRETYDNEKESIIYAIQRMEDVDIYNVDMDDKNEILIKMALDCFELNDKFYYRKAEHLFKCMDDIDSWDLKTYILLAQTLGEKDIFSIQEVEAMKLSLIDIELQVDNAADPLERLKQYELLNKIYYARKNDMGIYGLDKLLEILKKQDETLEVIVFNDESEREVKKNMVSNKMLTIYFQRAKETSVSDKEYAIQEFEKIIQLIQDDDLKNIEIRAYSYWNLYHLKFEVAHLYAALKDFEYVSDKHKTSNMDRHIQLIKEELWKYQ